MDSEAGVVGAGGVLPWPKACLTVMAAHTRRNVLDRTRPLDMVARNPVPFSSHFTAREILTQHVQDSFRRDMQEVATDRTRPRCAGPQVERNPLTVRLRMV